MQHPNYSYDLSEASKTTLLLLNVYEHRGEEIDAGQFRNKKEAEEVEDDRAEN